MEDVQTSIHRAMLTNDCLKTMLPKTKTKSGKTTAEWKIRAISRQANEDNEIDKRIQILLACRVHLESGEEGFKSQPLLSNTLDNCPKGAKLAASTIT